MRELSSSEILALREALQTETNGLITAKAAKAGVSNPQLHRLVEAAIMASETRIRTMQQFINENGILSTGEVR